MATRKGTQARAWLTTTLLVVSACSEPVTVNRGPLDPGFHIEPTNPILTAGTSLQFRAFSQNGAELAVLWRLQNAEFGSITSAGILSSCWASGISQLTARLQADTTRQVSTQVTLIQPAVGLIGVTALHYASTAAPVRLDSVAGAIDASINVAAGVMACREVTSVRLELLGPSSPVLLGQVTFTPPLTTTITLTIHWNAGAVPPGPYGLRAVMAVRDHGETASTATPIQISP